MKKLMTLALMLFAALMVNAQMAKPVHMSSKLKTNGTAEGEIVFSGSIDPGWHV